MNNTIGVYLIGNYVNEMAYIGSSVNMQNRIASHFNSLKNNKHTNSDMQAEFNNLGNHRFYSRILCYCDKESLIKKEQEYIDSLENLYNKRTSLIGSHTRNVKKKALLSQSLPVELIERLKKEAKRRNRSVTNLIETWIKEKLDLL